MREKLYCGSFCFKMQQIRCTALHYHAKHVHVWTMEYLIGNSLDTKSRFQFNFNKKRKNKTGLNEFSSHFSNMNQAKTQQNLLLSIKISHRNVISFSLIKKLTHVGIFSDGIFSFLSIFEHFAVIFTSACQINLFWNLRNQLLSSCSRRKFDKH